MGGEEEEEREECKRTKYIKGPNAEMGRGQ